MIDIVQPNQPPLVAKGCEKPLVRPPFNAAGIHGSDGLGELHQFKNADGSPSIPNLPWSLLQKMLLMYCSKPPRNMAAT
ncbi:hypothetical protein [Moorena sp. SIO4A1]|uniref:hypothetical protein n=2 Tax=Moorena TaxID=1155738 RepID=UPI0025E8DD01|nr:hypothetical protein [Moorena sp. SIO4A1]